MKTVLSIICLFAAASFVIDGASRRRIRNLRQSGVYPPPGRGTEGDVRRLLSLGRKIDAIKLYREIRGVDLKSAKKAVDKLAQEPKSFE